MINKQILLSTKVSEYVPCADPEGGTGGRDPLP